MSFLKRHICLAEGKRFPMCTLESLFVGGAAAAVHYAVTVVVVVVVADNAILLKRVHDVAGHRGKAAVRHRIDAVVVFNVVAAHHSAAARCWGADGDADAAPRESKTLETSVLDIIVSVLGP